MDKFEQKYGIEEDERVKTFHRSRRMFCIYQGKLFIAKPNLPYSHATWFEKEGWMSKGKKELIDEITRGIVDDKGDVYFYTGYDFRINNDTESIFFSHLKELVKKLKLNTNASIYGGLKKLEPGELWPAIKEYGKIRENIK